METRLLYEIKEMLLDLNSRRADYEESLTSKEAAAFLKVNRQRLLIFIKLGLPYYDIGKGYTFKRIDLIQFREKFRHDIIEFQRGSSCKATSP